MEERTWRHRLWRGVQWLALGMLTFALLRWVSFGIAEAVGPAVGMLRAGGEGLKAQALQGGYNILFILTDQERYFPTYPSGSRYAARERLKSIGTTFEKHYICSSISTPSRSVILTGKHIPDTKMFELTNQLYQASMNPDLPTVGDRMRSLGYYTAYKGKLHLLDSVRGSDPPQQQDALEPYGFSDWNPQGDIWGQPGEGYTADPGIAGDAVGWLRSTGTQVNAAGQPFFLVVGLVNPHDIAYFNTDLPGVNEQDTGDLFVSIQRAPDNDLYRTTYPGVPLPATWQQGYGDQVAAHEEFNKCNSVATGKIPDRRDNWERFRDFYFNTLQDSDDRLTEILDELQALGMMRNTIIVMTSDHGELQGSHSLNGKGNNLYEYDNHVPLVIYHPDLPGGRSVPGLTSHLDLAATFVGLSDASAAAKAEASAGLAGKDLTALLRNPAGKVREDALFACSMLSLLDSSIPPNTLTAQRQLASSKRGIVRGLVTAEGYKFARYFMPSGFNTPRTLEELYAQNDVEIFDLNTDPEERTNLAASLRSTNPLLVMALNERLNRIISQEIGEDTGREFSEIPEPSAPRRGGGGGCDLGLSGGPILLTGLGALLARRRRRSSR